MSINRSKNIQNPPEFSPTTPSAMYTPSGSFPQGDVSATRTGDAVVLGPDPAAPDFGMGKKVNAARFGEGKEPAATEARGTDLSTLTMDVLSKGPQGDL